MRLYPATNWRRLYAAATLAGAAAGLLVVLGALPAIPHQVTTWVRSVDNKLVALLAALAAGALLGLALAAVAHIGVVWQLRRRSRHGAGPLLLGLGLMLWASPVGGQAPASLIRGPATSLLFMAATADPNPAILPDTTVRVIQPTQWKKGLLIGGVIGAGVLGALGYLLCEDLSETRESCLGPGLGGAAVGATMGGIVGALIGGQIPKQTDQVPVADST